MTVCTTELTVWTENAGVIVCFAYDLLLCAVWLVLLLGEEGWWVGSGIGDVPTSGNVQRGFLKLNLFHLKDFCDKEYCSALETDFFFF